MRNRLLVAGIFILVLAYGVFALKNTPVDAIPDLSENQVIVFADWTGRSPQEVEDQITYPLSTSLQGLAGVREVRGISMFGFSLLTVIFDDNIDNYFARTRVLERLNFLGGQLPQGVTARLGPDATGLGWVYQYYLDVDPAVAKGADLGALRSLQDYFIRYQLASVPGVAEVASVGGFVRQYQIAVSSGRMRASGVSLQEVMEALAAANLNVGGKVIEENGQEFVVRGIGLVSSAADIENVVVRSAGGTPVYVRDLGTVSLGGDFRRGALDVDGREVVGGTVVMRTGENARAIIEAIKNKIAQIQPSLPAGVTIKAFYDRSGLIDRTIDTLKGALIEEVLLVTLAHILFLWHFRSVLIVTIPLPASILISFILMRLFGITSNVMSLAGIAIAIGVLVDAAIVITENVIRHCEQEEKRKGAPLTRDETLRITGEAATQVGRPVFFAMVIIILAFLPVFALTGQEGKLFHPLAFTKTFAMVAATILAVTVVPVLCSWLVKGPFHPEGSNFIMRPLLAIYRPALDWALAHGRAVFLGAFALLLCALFLAFGLPLAAVNALRAAGLPKLADFSGGMGSEFMPTLNEGSLLFMPVLLPSTSLTEVKRIMAWQDRMIREVPEVESAAGKLGRSDTPTDPAPVEMIETTIMLKPQAQWRAGMTPEKLVAELTTKLSQVPGYVPGFLQPIENRILMLSTGIRAQLGVKILGSDLSTLQRKAFEVEKVLRTVPGAVGVAPSRVQAKPYLEIIPDRVKLARYGLSLRDVLDYVEAGIGGVNVTTTIDGRQRIPVQVRLQRSERDDIAELGNILVRGKDGTYVPLGQIADIRRDIGPSEIQSQDGLLKLFVQSNVQGRDLGGFVAEVEKRLAAEVAPEPGVTIVFSGQYENQLSARQTLQAVVPAVVLIIFLLLFVTFRSVTEAAHVILALPFALTGGVFLQRLLGYNFSVAVWVGYIALFGTAIQTGVVMVVYLEEALRRKREELGAKFSRSDLLAAVKEGAVLRLRPKVMTVSTVIASLLPIMWSTKTGAEVMKPIAAPVIGGMISSLLHILVVTPVIFYALRSRELFGPRREP
ncbi:MAG: efflux RND transporter permease subunit [Chthoniobacterales bacterium]|nr:efflux RND transporter permease subunit [Chthoniobacterales bacterium]